ncbi:membrane insertase OXA1 ASCRUDRAFT_76069 [Ascoidea rubescens DSM 1968]|uniref:Membrane insertase YidC/Oxa/ALB C-terminal domain-containing protein n=1 Tax=Ascoidea rubescens DSM 1968 TaxID=1344418 RepID=A0A1D2VGB3_9ASCO|nr:hypothetical protein ASCRUDRAFT_76069 [Ascoidea rubescens DSM 1968]ODV60698.1 hypothetical protein ASCRUDRAFT_76069 [Ascoidea rubescens DSM 1968]
MIRSVLSRNAGILKARPLSIGVVSSVGIGFNRISDFKLNNFKNVNSFNNDRSQISSIRYNSTSSLSPVGSTLAGASEGLENKSSEISTTLTSFADSSSELISNANGELCTYIGYFENLGLAKSWWWPPDFVTHLFEYVHVYTGLPWWGTIMTVAIGVRILLFPLYIKSADNQGKMNNAKPELDAIQEQMKEITSNPDRDVAKVQRLMQRRRLIMQKHDIKTRYLIAPLIQVPFAIGIFASIRTLTGIPIPGFENQGILWFTDLNAADPYLGLQIITAAAYVLFIRLGGETAGSNLSPTMLKVLTGLPVLSIPLTMNFSSGLVFYFAINALFSIIQNMILRNKSFRKFFNISQINRNAQAKGKPFSIKEFVDAKVAQNKAQLEDQLRIEEIKEKRKHQKDRNTIMSKEEFDKMFVNKRKQ